MKWNAALLSLMVAAGLMMVSPPRLRAQAPLQNSAARTLFIEGRDLWDEGKFADAEKKFREALAKYPKAEQSDRTAYYLITTLVKLSRTADARIEIDNFDKNYPQSMWKSDVEEKRLMLNGLPAMFQGGRYAVGVKVVGAERVVTPVIAPSHRDPQTFNNDTLRARVFVNASLEQEVLRLLIQTDANRGIEQAKERLKVNPSDPAVVTNLSTIAGSGSSQALPFLLTLAGNTAITPNTKSQALFWMNRVDNETVAKALSEMMKEKDAIPTVIETLSRFNVAERRNALDQLAKGTGPERIATLDKLYKGTTNTAVRSQIIQSVGPIADPSALAFLTDLLRNEKETSLRNTAIRTLVERKDIDGKTLEDILKSLPPTPPKPGLAPIIR